MRITLNLEHVVPNWLGRQYQRHTIRRAVSQAQTAFAQEHPEWAASLFDEHFLIHRVMPFLENSGHDLAELKPATLANTWAEQMTWFNKETRQRLVTELTPAASDFLRLLKTELYPRTHIRKSAVTVA